jgi:hypothetical protein
MSDDSIITPEEKSISSQDYLSRILDNHETIIANQEKMMENHEKILGAFDVLEEE